MPLGAVGRGMGAALGRGVGAAVGEAINIALKEGLAKVLRGNTGRGPGVGKPGSGVPTREQLAEFPAGILPAGQNINRVGRGTRTSPGIAPADFNSPDVGSFQNTRTRKAKESSKGSKQTNFCCKWFEKKQERRKKVSKY